MGPVRRQSRLRDGVQLLHGDLHNHTLLSDGAGDPETAFQRMRAAGLDVAALTDHASIPAHAVPHLNPEDYPDAEALRIARMPPDSLDAAAWVRTGELADAADVPGEFTALRGFEWTEPYVGHANVWYSASVRDVHRPGRMQGLHDWLVDEEPDALFGYNHPGREAGRFDDYHFDPRVAPRMVSLELFNRSLDFLHVDGRSPLVDALAAGWRPGVIGVSDEHGRDYGLAGRGRTGIWAGEHSRPGVRAAMLARSTYATREQGLLLDATLGGVPAGESCRAGVDLELAVDLDGGPALVGRQVLLELLLPGSDGLPAVAVQLPAQVGAVTTTRVAPLDTPWLVLRVADPARPEGPVGGTLRALSYASPWWLAPA